ncbi:hypothetical protein N9Y42_10890 [Mariniblastus sp.]|nr:hypothetical protein [Mariniblastus sp.]
MVPPPNTVCGCGCGSSTGVCTDHPNCDYRVHPSPGGYTRRVTKTFNIQNPTEVDCGDGISETVPFYDRDISGNGMVEVPVTKKKCIEKYKFESRSYSLCGCKIEVCVPCEIVCDETDRCEPVAVQTPVKVRIRRELEGGQLVADVWVENVTGLPNPSVLGLKMTAQAIDAKFSTGVLF